MTSRKRRQGVSWCIHGIMMLYILLSFFGSFSVMQANTQVPVDGSLNLVPCGRIWNGTAWVEEPCTFKHLNKLFENVIRAFFLVMIITMGFLIIRVGFMYLNSNGNPVKLAKAKKSFWHFGIGILIMVSAWLFYEFVVSNILADEFNNPLQNTPAQQTQQNQTQG